MGSQLAEAVVIVNNEAIGIVPNTLKFSEGLGEQAVHPVSVGGGKTEQVFANNLETNFGRVMFEVRTTVDNVELVRGWKLNGNGNVIQVAAEADGQQLTRTFNQAVLTGDYDIEIGSDTTITLEFQTAQAA